MRIVAMGGGDVSAGHTLALDQTLIGLAGKADPRLLFVPTATEDSPEYVEKISKAYGDLGCEVESLLLLSDPDLTRAKAKIDRADLIYVGGGNTKQMLEIWRKTGVADYLIQSVKAGKPVGGISAGAICWFRVGNSDWPQYEGIEGVNTARLDGLGLVDLVICPHTLNEPFRLGDFREMMKTETGVGVGIDDYCAIQIEGETYRILASRPGSVGHRIYWQGGVLHEEILEPSEAFAPLKGLYP